MQAYFWRNGGCSCDNRGWACRCDQAWRRCEGKDGRAERGERCECPIIDLLTNRRQDIVKIVMVGGLPGCLGGWEIVPGSGYD